MVSETAPPLAASTKPAMLLDPETYAYVREGYRSSLPVSAQAEPRLRAVVADAVACPGRLVRAQLLFGMLSASGFERADGRDAAVAIEYFHTASLLFDDLPCMDDARTRRGQPCAHVAHGEAAAILGALGFVNQGYALLWSALAKTDGDCARRAADLVAECLGVDGVLNGQSRDVHFAEGSRSAEAVRDVALGKTVTLIRLTLVLPGLMLGVSDAAIARLTKLSRAWGLAYQVMDDFKDCLLAPEESGKTSLRDALLGRPNYPAAAGREVAAQELGDLLADGHRSLHAVLAVRPEWSFLLHLQETLEAEGRNLIERLALMRACA